tara:strand:- start:929 stop:1270 length:342 start_codon:yes stop_codon:yes gene_type:complete
MNIIFFIHLVFFVTMLVVPFMNNKKNLEFYSLLVPFIFFHWSINDDMCALTQLEMIVTGECKDKTFFGRIMKPIYMLEDTHASKVLKSLLFTLWMIVQFRLGRIDLSPLYKKK